MLPIWTWLCRLSHSFPIGYPQHFANNTWFLFILLIKFAVVLIFKHSDLFIYLFAESLLLQERVKLPPNNRCLVSVSQTRAIAHPLFSRSRNLIGKPNKLKVYCLYVHLSFFPPPWLRIWEGCIFFLIKSVTILILCCSYFQVLCFQKKEIPVVEGRYCIFEFQKLFSMAELCGEVIYVMHTSYSSVLFIF